MAQDENPYDAARRDDDVFVAPPTDRGEYADNFVEPAKWPKFYGIVSIVWGALGLLCGGLGAAWMGFGPRMMQSSAANLSGGMPPAITTVNPAVLAITIVGTLWAILLVTAGSMCVARKRATRPAHLVWAVGAIVLTAIGTKMNLDLQAEIAQWVRDNPNADFSKAQQNPGSGIGNMLGLAFGLIFGLVWPITTLVWFGLIKTKADELTAGVEEFAA